MTAAEALELTLASKKSLKDVMTAIEAMAKGGYRYASFEKDSIIDSTLIEIKELGYQVNVLANSILIEW